MEDQKYRKELADLRRVITPVRLINPNAGREVLTDAYWDTGAETSSILKMTAEYLRRPVMIDRCHMNGLGGKVEGRSLLTVALPGDARRGIIVEAFEAETIPGDFDFIIGMDIISKGDFSIRRKGEHSVLEFTFGDDFFHIKE